MTYEVVTISHKGDDLDAYKSALENRLEGSGYPIWMSEEFAMMNWLGSIYGEWIESNTDWAWDDFYRECVDPTLDYDPDVYFGFDNRDHALLFKLTFGGAA